MVRRTKKEFKPYNDYVDRPFELKWPTAFPLGELTEAIKNTDEYHARNIERLPQQSQKQIEYFLDRSIKQNKVLEIQLNSLDEYDRVKPHVCGVFREWQNSTLLWLEKMRWIFMILETFRFIISRNGAKSIYLNKIHLRKKQNVARQ